MESCVFQVNLKSGTNILYWRTGGVLMGSKVLKPALLKNIHIEGQEEVSSPLAPFSIQSVTKQTN